MILHLARRLLAAGHTVRPGLRAGRWSEHHMKTRPLIYSCSGCSSAAQLANHLALRMDRAMVAEMSCIAGLGGDVKPLVRTATNAAESGRPIIVLDGCPLQCGRQTLARHGIEPDLHWDLSRMGVSKRKHEDFSHADAARLEPHLAEEIAELQGNPDHEPDQHFLCRA